MLARTTAPRPPLRRAAVLAALAAFLAAVVPPPAGAPPAAENWIFDIGHGYPGGPGDWGTGEIQRYTADPANIGQDAATWEDITGHGYFLLLNVAMGGAFPDGEAGHATPGPATVPGRPMIVDYVAVWRSG